MAEKFDLIVIGGGTAGITAARVGGDLGIKTLLIEKNRIGGDCTWTGCVPSKSLLKVAKVMHDIREAGSYGITASAPTVDMTQVREYVNRVIHRIYEEESPEKLKELGVTEVLIAEATFIDPNTIEAGGRTFTSNRIILTTGSRAFVPPIDGLADVPFHTNETFFDNDRLPQHLMIIGAGPIGCEMGQAYRRLGAEVTLIDVGLLPRDEPEVREVIGKVFEREGINFVPGLVSSARQEGNEIVLSLKDSDQTVRGDMLLVAVGRAANVDGLGLDKAGVKHSRKGIEIDGKLQTSAPHIFAAGDCVAGNYQFTHLAGWQAAKAVQNALTPNVNGWLYTKAQPSYLPWVTFTDPEAAHVGMTEAEAREKYGKAAEVVIYDNFRSDRAIAENDLDGFVKVIHKNGKLLGATIVNQRAGEMILEFTIALKKKFSLIDLADIVHPYPTYNTVSQILISELLSEELRSGLSGRAVNATLKVLVR